MELIPPRSFAPLAVNHWKEAAKPEPSGQVDIHSQAKTETFLKPLRGAKKIIFYSMIHGLKCLSHSGSRILNLFQDLRTLKWKGDAEMNSA